ncbi:MAG: hypothetical protein ABI425_03755 [Patescibacteria group bacterium]
MKKLGSILATSVVTLFFSYTFVFAQTPSTQSQFPFTINGTECNSKAECRVLCDDPVNAAACASLNPNPSPRVDRFLDPAFVQATTAELGCSSVQSCKAVCSLKINFEKCDQFARTHVIAGGYDKKILTLSTDATQANQPESTDPDIALLREAEAQLVTPGQTLEEFCGQAANQTVCSTLAKKLGLRGGLKLQGPGGCHTTDSCRTYCNDPAHFAECKSFEVPGLNGCTSELACYNEVQTHPEALKDFVAEKISLQNGDQNASGSGQVNEAELEQTCLAVSESYQGKTTEEFASDMSRSGVCQALPKTGVPGKNSNCDAYLASNQPFDKTIFEKICAVTPVIVSEGLKTVDTQTAATNLDSYQQWCRNLPSVGQAESDWQVVPSLCEHFVSSFQEARVACEKPETERPEWLKDAVAYSRYCLSAPSDTGDYARSCAADPTNCQSNGFDWYCKQAGKSCVPLYQGRPVDQSVETFASAGLVKDGDKVSLIVDENTQTFAEGALADAVQQTGASSQFQVVSGLPETVSPNAVFVSGTGVSQRGFADQRFFKPTLFGVKRENPVQNRVASISPTESSVSSGQSFAQPWFLLDAHQQSTPAVQGTVQNVQTQPQTGWNSVRSSAQELRQEYLKQQTSIGTELKKDAGVLLPKIEIRIDPNVFQPQQVSPVVAPQNELEMRRVEPTRLPTTFINRNSGSTNQQEPTKYPTSRPANINELRSETSGTTSTNNQTLTTTHVEPTKIPVQPTSIPQTQTGSTETHTGTSATSGNGSSGTGDGSTPAVQGIETEQNMWEMIKETVLHFFS